MNLDDIILEHEFFLTLSKFWTRTDPRHFPEFNLPDNMYDAVSCGHLFHLIKWGSKGEHYKRGLFGNWIEDEPTEYRVDISPYVGNLGCDKLVKKWWGNAYKPDADMSKVEAICEKYEMDILYPEVFQKPLQSGKYKSEYAECYILLVETSCEPAMEMHRKFQRNELLSLSKAFYERVCQSEFVKKVSDKLCNIRRQETEGIDGKYDLEYSVNESKVIFITPNSYFRTDFIFSQMGLKNLPIAEDRIGLGFAIAAALIKRTMGIETVDIATSDMVDVEVRTSDAPTSIVNRFSIRFKIKYDFPKTIKIEPILMDW